MTAIRFDKYPERTPLILSLAQGEAQCLNHKYLGSEHILLALIKEEEETAARILIDLGVSLPKLRSAVEYVVGCGKKNDSPNMILTRGAERVIELGIDEARQMGHDYIDSEHVLLALLRESDDVAAGVLDAFGVTLEKARIEVTSLHPPREGQKGTQSSPVSKQKNDNQ